LTERETRSERERERERENEGWCLQTFPREPSSYTRVPSALFHFRAFFSLPTPPLAGRQ
jgi:hypothetical protein